MTPRTKFLLVLSVTWMAVVVAGCSRPSSTASSGGTDASSTEGSTVPAGEAEPNSAVIPLGEVRFTQPWGCGWGFAVTNESRTIALFLREDGIERVKAGHSVVDLSDPAWRSEVLFGENLLSVDCADLDVAQPSEPSERWPITGGTLDIDAPQAAFGCGTLDPGIAVARGLTVVVPDGTTVTLPDLTIVNDRWGCSAG